MGIPRCPSLLLLLSAASLCCAGCRDHTPAGPSLSPAPSASASATPDPLAAAWPSRATTTDQLRSFGLFHGGVEWKELTWQAMRVAVALETLPTDGESYIDVHAYVYNEHFREWRRFVSAQVRGAGLLEVRLEPASGLLTFVGAAQNDKKGRSLLTFDLHAVHDDH